MPVVHCYVSLAGLSGSPPGSYSQDIPIKLAAASPASPPTLPPQLLQVILNTDAPLQVFSFFRKIGLLLIFKKLIDSSRQFSHKYVVFNSVDFLVQEHGSAYQGTKVLR